MTTEQRIIAGLKARGIDTSGVESQLAASAGKAGRDFLNNDLMDRAEFNTYKTANIKEKEELIATAQQLLSAKAASESKTEEFANAAVAEVARLEGILLNKFKMPQEQIDTIDAEDLQLATNSLNKQRAEGTSANQNNNSNNNKGNVMDENKIAEQFQAGVVNSAGAAVMISSKINQQLERYRRLNPDKPLTIVEMDEFTSKSWAELKNKMPDQIAEELWKLNEAEQKVNAAAELTRTTQIGEEAVAKYKREHPEAAGSGSATFDKGRGGVFAMQDVTRRGRVASTINNNVDNANNANQQNNQDNQNPNGDPTKPKEIRAGDSDTPREFIKTSGFKPGEAPHEIRESGGGRSGRLSEVMSAVEERNLDVYSDL